PMREQYVEEKKQEWWEQSSQIPLVLATSEADQWGGAPDWSQPSPSQRSRTSMKRNTRNNSARNNSMRNNSMRNNSARNNPLMGRRKVVALLATGGVVAAGVLVGAKLNLGAHTPATATITTQATGNTVAKTQPVKTQPAKTQPAKTNGPTAQTPKKQPPVKHTGTVIGSKAMAPNTSVVFNNNQDLLIRLPNGNFVAYNRSCTHQQVLINYDPITKKMVCPAHGAIFDPAQNAKVLLGPAPTPVKAVKVSVNNDGTITMV
ncbi:MAG: Rieske (2Fe-2S) protein, partial [Ktedonobacteraceae bacterium]|nr:Rieske (2Fe-2S) protein [Ktedonobacteraceae bacterium]